MSLTPRVPGSLEASTTCAWISGSTRHGSLDLWEHPSHVPGSLGASTTCPCHHGSLDLWEHPPQVPATTGPWISGSTHHGSLDLWEHPRVQMALVPAWTFTFTLGAGKPKLLLRCGSPVHGKVTLSIKTLIKSMSHIFSFALSCRIWSLSLVSVCVEQLRKETSSNTRG